ncbi:protein kinase domain-containing protein [Rubinisphaera italica]|uniref:Serine/threonine-protein kinase PknB n=1 Tax=Rubinisphaera italica TaxID=2527969 RepID=A0A5C5XIR1_9PLAN|nr:FHA domain-containing serine/threonine-protein kinase [Rubinisphaera italica]TWT62910.1 Serine/threonine-protein kinase PknB [Rubinisphaera italica]
MNDSIELHIEEGPLMGKAFQIEQHDILICGRSKKDCHIALPKDGYISRHHFLMEVNPPLVQIRDLGSRNGTYINGVKYGGRTKGESIAEAAAKTYATVELQNGDRLRVGKTVIHVTINTAPKIVQPEKVHSDTVKMKFASCSTCGIQIPVMAAEMVSAGQFQCESCQAIKAQRFDEIRSQITSDRSDENAVFPQVSGFQINERLGKGGMGEVYLATSLENCSPVAIKTFHTMQENLKSKSIAQEFVRECEILDSLRHPNIVQFYDVGMESSFIYCVMEYCNHGSLDNYHSENKDFSSPVNMAEIFIELLDALHYAHQSGYIHRDIKPENILIQKEQNKAVPKLSDFGLSKNYQTAGFSGLTVTGSFSGTLDYMPREQLTNYKYLNPVSDLWSLAASYYYLVTGCYPRPRNEGDDPLEIILTKDAIPIREKSLSVPSAIAEVIDKALATQPEDRYQDASEMLDALTQAIQ